MLRDWIENDTFLWLVNEEILDEYKAILQRLKVRPKLIGEAKLRAHVIAPGDPIPTTARKRLRKSL
jgi:hypothetical protein